MFSWTRHFHRRIYRHPLTLLRDMACLLRQLPAAWRILQRHSLAPALRERLMLAVSGVNRCRYCVYGHSVLALREGLDAGEIGALLGRDLTHSPAAERIAIGYALHWAENDGRPDPALRARLAEVHGAAVARDIDAALCFIRVGNLSGNTLDWWLALASFGRFGLHAGETGHPAAGGG